jgi:hypothetical protein
MHEVLQDFDPLLHNEVRLPAADVGKKPNTARIVLILRIV